MGKTIKKTRVSPVFNGKMVSSVFKRKKTGFHQFSMGKTRVSSVFKGKN
jgi:hypothetical protein